MPGLTNNIENIIGSIIPPRIAAQLKKRSKETSRNVRDDDNLVYIANKTGWIRVVSSIDVNGSPNVAKNWVLFGGVSKYMGPGAYSIRGGISQGGPGGAWGMMGDPEIIDYGYRPLPGITSAKIVSQGKLGSIRSAIINFKVNDKRQLDVIDKLYFKLGYSIIIEWGSTVFYTNGSGTISNGEDYSIDPFAAGLTKDEILAIINARAQLSDGNYDAMFGIVTNFSFSFNKDGQYDCVLQAQALGVMGEGMRMNNINVLPAFLLEEIKQIEATTNAFTAPMLQEVQKSPDFMTFDYVTPVIPNRYPSQYQSSVVQNKEKVNYSSYLECMLRGIKLHCYNKIKPQLDGNVSLPPTERLKVYTFDLKNEDEDFIKSIFAEGGMSALVAGGFAKGGGMFGENAYYCFARALMAAGIGEERDAVLGSLPATRFEDIVRATIVTYRQSKSSIDGYDINHPCYIPLSFFFMMINHASLLYEQDKGNNVPLLYLDFNPYVNYCLTNENTFSTDPFKFLIPYEGSQAAYQNLFDPKTIAGDKFDSDDPKNELWRKEDQDRVSKLLLPFHDIASEYAPYRGRIMNVNVSIDYLLFVISEYTTKNDTNSINLKSMIEAVLADINKTLGNFNVFRLAYSDRGNVFYISDDQVIPSAYGGQIYNGRYVDLPIYGKESIAEDITIRTDMSTRITNLLATSANKDAQYQATAGADSSPLAIGHGQNVDRYKPLITAPGDGGGNVATGTTVESAIQFNASVKDMFFTGDISETSVPLVTNFFIERMAKLKATNKATVSSVIIPVSINVTMDGIGGLSMGQGFTVPQEILPYAYNGVAGDTRQIGFIITGLEQTIESNRWRTNIKAIMSYLKNPTDYKGNIEGPGGGGGGGGNGGGGGGGNGGGGGGGNGGGGGGGLQPVFGCADTPQTNYVASDAQARAGAEQFLGRPMSNTEWDWLVRATNAEAGANQTERANVMGVILNRTRTNYGSYGANVVSQLSAPSQFEAVTGNRKKPGPSSRFINQPNSADRASILGASNSILPNVNRRYMSFTSAIQDRYSFNNGAAAINRLRLNGGVKIGCSWFGY